MYIWLFIPISIGILLGSITIFYNIRKFKKQGFLYYLPKDQRLNWRFRFKGLDYSGSIKVFEKEDPERFKIQIKRLFNVATIYLSIAIIFLILFIFIQI